MPVCVGIAGGDMSEIELMQTNRRNVLLAGSDWTQLPDAPADKTAWAEYRQQLRDLPNDPAWPNANFPDPPA